MYIVYHRSLFFWITGAMLAGAIGAILVWGLPLGIDFKGGSLMQVDYQNERPALADIQKQVDTLSLGTVSVRAHGDNGIAIRARTMTPEEHIAVLSAVSSVAPATELSYTSVGPALGSQFTNKALWAIFAVMLVIVLYIAFAFRKVSRPVPSWGYGLTVVAMLAIDIIVPAGFFAAFAHFTGAEVDSLFIVALLALLGYCVNDVIVIFDRIREHLNRNETIGLRESFEDTIGKSINETMTRSINTALTVALALLVLIFLGAPATRDFALVMLVGVIAGTFSSICRSAPLLIPIANWFAKK
ncbi:protein-export membrane protein SecF [Candidatus Kaiserbacteria bacterium RIFCSPLOWO2_01_FULL_52_12b]|uniref:Protein-export membrane protein SecF n=1 Tax=Candidatus Kaiserbacteria bacterium RIFCSPLOWO2_01_FULL_52_12b TaxID=1798509 RepID=A0A1F6EX98_9BACT|nr:MAG: protein-export membrane protein SecF [Candidatus Kaiserbacteria bacterium RIFCSPLOWO2_01_FULL_52_12b]